MSHFYGTLKNGNGKQSTRCGHKTNGITAIAARWGGAIEVQLFHRDGRDCYSVNAIKWKGSGVDGVIARGTVGKAPRPQKVVIKVDDGVVAVESLPDGVELDIVTTDTGGIDEPGVLTYSGKSGKPVLVGA